MIGREIRKISVATIENATSGLTSKAKPVKPTISMEYAIGTRNRINISKITIPIKPITGGVIYLQPPLLLCLFQPGIK